MSNEMEQFAAFMGLLVKHAGGEVKIPYDVVEEGLPAGHGVRVINDEEGEQLIFVLQDIEAAKAALEAENAGS